MIENQEQQPQQEQEQPQKKEQQERSTENETSPTGQEANTVENCAESVCAEEQPTVTHKDAVDAVDTSDDNSVIDMMSYMCRQQQVQLVEALALFLTDNDRNICQHLTDIKDAILTNNKCLAELKRDIVNNSKCLLKLNDSIKGDSAGGRAVPLNPLAL